MKDSFGFIKRSDVAGIFFCLILYFFKIDLGEIFFHYSQVSADVPDLREGNDVEFAIEQRKDKQVAVSITLLPEGSVVFDDISKCQYNGIIKKLGNFTLLLLDLKFEKKNNSIFAKLYIMTR